MGNRMDDVQGLRRRLQKSLQALNQDNMGSSQLPHLVRQRKIWFQILKNLREIEGSWPAAIRRTFLMYEGHPRKKDRPR
jgi:hypothetical protein